MFSFVLCFYYVYLTFSFNIYMFNCGLSFFNKRILFSPLDKLARRATYFADILFLNLIFKIFFNGRLSNTCFSQSNGLIFKKILGLVDGWKG